MNATQTCPRCAANAAPRLTWQRCANGTLHLRASCPTCGGFLRYLPQTPANVAQAGPRPSGGQSGYRSLFDALEGQAEGFAPGPG